MIVWEKCEGKEGFSKSEMCALTIEQQINPYSHANFYHFNAQRQQAHITGQKLRVILSPGHAMAAASVF